MNKNKINLTKPILIEDLGTQFSTINSKEKEHFGLFECQLCPEKRIFKSRIRSITSGHTVSCGCYQITIQRERKRTHGMSKTPLHDIWLSIKNRCKNQNDARYSSYGGRGITICGEWGNDFLTFYNWCVSNGYKKGLYLDRENNEGNYEPSNCRFITPTESVQNTRLLRSTNTSGFRGVSFHRGMKKWDAKITVNYKTIRLGYFSTPNEAAIAYNEYVTNHNFLTPLNKIENSREIICNEK